MRFNTITAIFNKIGMEIKITASKRKSSYVKENSAITSTVMERQEKFYPLFELIAQDLQKILKGELDYDKID